MGVSRDPRLEARAAARRLRHFWRYLEHRRLKVLLVDGPDGAKLRLVEKQRRPVSPGGWGSRRRRGEPAPENEVICQMAPQSRFCPRAECVTLVRNYTTEPKTWEGLVRLEEIKEIRRRARGRWDANGAPDPASLVATGEPTGCRARRCFRARELRPPRGAPAPRDRSAPARPWRA